MDKMTIQIRQRRFTAFLLAMVMLLGMMPGSSYAETYTITQDGNGNFCVNGSQVDSISSVKGEDVIRYEEGFSARYFSVTGISSDSSKEKNWKMNQLYKKLL